MTEQGSEQPNNMPEPPPARPSEPSAGVPTESAAGASTEAPSYPPAPPPQEASPAFPALPEFRQPGPPGTIRNTPICILLYFVTLGFYGLYWYYKVHEEMKRHTNQGIGGPIALILALFIGIVMPYISSSETGTMYESTGKPKPVSGLTGLWYFPGIFILVGPFIWFIKTNEALNAYWASQGVVAT